VSKLKALKLELFSDLLVHLVLIFLPKHFRQFKVSNNTHEDKWNLNKLISHSCVQKEERQQKENTKYIHLASNSQDRRQTLKIGRVRIIRILQKGFINKK